MKTGSVFFIFIFLWGMAGSLRAEDALRLVVFDVGEGQAVLLVREQMGMLIDTGLSEKSEVVLNGLKKYGVNSLSAIVLTHLHPDHAGAVFSLKKRYPKVQIYESGHRSVSRLEPDSYHRMVKAFDARGYRVEQIKQNDGWVWNRVNISVLWPSDISGGTVNRKSLVLHVRFGDKNILIMGDAGTKVEALLRKEDRLPVGVDLLVVGHHGARDATGMAFIKKVKPVEAVISVNEDNRNGYPDRGVIERVQRYSERIHITSRDGDFARQYILTE